MVVNETLRNKRENIGRYFLFFLANFVDVTLALLCFPGINSVGSEKNSEKEKGKERERNPFHAAVPLMSPQHYPAFRESTRSVVNKTVRKKKKKRGRDILVTLQFR